MKAAQRGLAAALGVLFLIILVGAALGNRMLGPIGLWGDPGPAPRAEGVTAGLVMALGWLTMLAFWGALVAGAILLIRALVRSGIRPGGTSARDILTRRYEAGGITREEYERACRALKGGRRHDVDRAAGSPAPVMSDDREVPGARTRDT
jgi:uncharacterized membrane protein